jgi:hypothetical protein
VLALVSFFVLPVALAWLNRWGDCMLRQNTANGLDFLGLMRLTLALSVAGFHLYRTYFQMLGDTRWLDFFALAVF